MDENSARYPIKWLKVKQIKIIVMITESIQKKKIQLIKEFFFWTFYNFSPFSSPLLYPPPQLGQTGKHVPDLDQVFL